MNKEIESEPKTLIGGGVAKWFNTMMPGAWAAFLSLAALAGLGVLFLWWVPDTTRFAKNLGEHWMFRRQMLRVGVGLSFFFLSLMVGWKRWLKAAPFVALGWLVVLAVAFCQMPVKGRHFLSVGSVGFDVWDWFEFVAALFSAWLAEKLAVRRVVSFVMIIFAIYVCGFAVRMVVDNDRRECVAAFFGCELPDASQGENDLARLWGQNESSEVLREAKWFTPSDKDRRKMFLPGRFSRNAPVAAALEKGKWIHFLVLALLGTFVYALVCCWRRTESVGKKVFVAVAGLSVVLIPALHGYGVYLGFIPPILYSGIPLISSGGNVWPVLIFAGVLVSIARDDAATDTAKGKP